MIKNYFKIAIRNLFRYKAFSFLNIAGLTLGLTATLLIMFWVTDEVSYNRFHKDLDKIQTVYAVTNFGEVAAGTGTPGLLGEALTAELPEVAAACQIYGTDLKKLFTVGQKFYKEDGGLYLSEGFFDVFDFPLLEGNPKTALDDPNSVIISESLARKLFKDQKALGQVVEVDGEGSLKVTGVIQEIPANSSIQFNYALPFKKFLASQPWLKTWSNLGPSTYLKLKDAGSAAVVAQIIKDWPGSRNPEAKIQLFLQPFADQYLYSNFTDGKIDGGRIEYVQLFSLVGIVILLIACINFMNLATARSLRRAKEVGIRKVIGATRKALIGQYIGEAVIMAAIAVLFSVVIVKLLIPTVNNFTQKNIAFNLLSPTVWVCLVGITLLIGIIAGSYPAFFLSAQKPVTVLKGALKFDFSTVFLRKGLVVFQFSLSILFIMGSFVIYRQMQYVKDKNLGMDRENLISVSLEGDLKNKLGAENKTEDGKKSPGVIETELLNSTAINSITYKQGSPVASLLWGRVKWPGKPEDDATSAEGMVVGYDFAKTLRVPVVAGRDFSREFSTDAKNYVINETAAKYMGMQDPIGQEIDFFAGKGKIIGVVKDYHFESLHKAIRPQIFMLMPDNTDQMLVRTEPGKTAQALQDLAKTVKHYNPNYPFEYHFVDELYEQQYKSETVVGELAKYFAFLAIFISCLGLFGLAAFTAEQRTKEIGIRKVLGASVANIVGLFSQDFVKLVLLSIVIALPTGYYFMDKWLQNFAYKQDINGWVFGITAGFTLLIALLTVSFQAIKAAVANPVKSLRNE